jgi:hypothetical protein
LPERQVQGLVFTIVLFMASMVPRTRLGPALTVLARDLPGVGNARSPPQGPRERGKDAPHGDASHFIRLRNSFMSQASTTSRPSANPERGQVIRQVTGRSYHLALPAHSERGYLVAALSGGLDAPRVPAVREQLLRLLRPAARDLSDGPVGGQQPTTSVFATRGRRRA